MTVYVMMKARFCDVKVNSHQAKAKIPFDDFCDLFRLFFYLFRFHFRFRSVWIGP